MSWDRQPLIDHGESSGKEKNVDPIASRDSDKDGGSAHPKPPRHSRRQQAFARSKGSFGKKISGNHSGPVKKKGVSWRQQPLEDLDDSLEMELDDTKDEAWDEWNWAPDDEAINDADQLGKGDNTSRQVATSHPSRVERLDFDIESFTGELSEALEVPEEKQDWMWDDLPLSPLMDPITLQARNNGQTPKVRPNDQRTLFQRRLYRNPYAIALSSPLRRCQLTRVALPRYFLQNFGLLGHPQTGKPFYVPRGWFRHRNSKGIQALAQETEYEKGEVGTDLEAEVVSDSMQPSLTPSTSKTSPPEKGPGMYTLCRQSLLQAMVRTDGGYGARAHAKLIPQRLREKPDAMKVLMAANFRSDMPDLVLELARRRLVNYILYLAGLERGYITWWDTWKNAKRKTQTGAYLWIGGNGLAKAEATEPPEFATFHNTPRGGKPGPGKQRKTPVYNMKVLLGQDKLEELQRHTTPAVLRDQPADNDNVQLKAPETFNKPIIAVQHRNNTAHLELQMWWLQGYIAQHKKLLESGVALGIGNTTNV